MYPEDARYWLEKDRVWGPDPKKHGPTAFCLCPDYVLYWMMKTAGYYEVLFESYQLFSICLLLKLI